MKKNIREVLYHDSNPEPPEIVYHYCSVESMVSILSNNCIWMSDSKKTNDRTEINWILNNVNQVFEESIEKYKKKYDGIIYQKIRDIIYEFIRIDILRYPDFMQRDYLVCFTTKGDMLSQWRAYGNNGCGVSLGFDTKYLSVLKQHYGYDFIKVIYMENPKHVLHKFVDAHLESILLSCIGKNSIEQEIIDIRRQIYVIAYDAYQYGYRIKNYNFKEEDEWRLHKKVLNFHKDESDNGEYDELIDAIFTDNRVGEYTRSKLKYRTNECDIISYLELGFEEIKTKILKEVILGPKCKIDKLDLKIFLTENGYIDNIYENPLNALIKNSKIPYA